MSYSNGLLSDQSYQTANKYVQRGLPGVGFKLTDTGDYDMQNKKLVNVDEGDNNQDVVNKHQLDVGLQTKPNKTDVLLLDGTTHMVGDLDLRGNKIILPGEIQMDQKLITNLDTDENQDLSAVNMITLKNKVEPKADKDYVDFEITKQNALINNTFVKKTGDQMNGDLILPHDSYPVEGNTNKAISYETQREIFLSRRESFPMQADINMNNNFIQNVATPTSSHQVTNKGYCDYNFLNRQKGGVIMGPLSMNRNDLIGIPETPKFGHSAVNKNYVDAKIPSVDSTQFVKKAGDLMIGDLDMGSHFVKNVGINLSDDSTVVPRSYVDSFANSAIHNPLERDLYASNFQIKQLKIPTDVQDAINKKYFDEELLKSHLLPSHIENAFKYLSDQDESSSERNIIVNGIQDYNGSPHKNKKAYDIDLIYTSGTQNYDSKIGINLYPLPVGKFTIIMEYYFPEDINISLLAEASTAIINKQTITNFPSYKKQLVQINQQTKDTPDYLFFTIRGSGTTATNPEGYLVFYGVKEWVDTVPSELYDHALETGMFEYNNGNMKMNTILDMNSNIIKNLADGIESDDAINKNQFDKLKKQFDPALNEINELKINTPNHIHMKLFTYGFYDLTNINTYKFNYIGSTPFISGIQPNIIFEAVNLSIPNSILENGILFPSRTNIVIRLDQTINESAPYTIMLIATLKNAIYVNFVGINNILTAPMFAVENDNLDLKIFLDPSTPINTKFPIEFKSKQVMIMIHHKPVSNTDNGIYSISLAGHNANITTYTTAPTNHTANRLRILANENIINKICYQNKNITFDDKTDYSKLLLEEKKMEHL